MIFEYAFMPALRPTTILCPVARTTVSRLADSVLCLSKSWSRVWGRWWRRKQRGERIQGEEEAEEKEDELEHKPDRRDENMNFSHMKYDSYEVELMTWGFVDPIGWWNGSNNYNIFNEIIIFFIKSITMVNGMKDFNGI